MNERSIDPVIDLESVVVQGHVIRLHIAFDRARQPRVSHVIEKCREVLGPGRLVRYKGATNQWEWIKSKDAQDGESTD